LPSEKLSLTSCGKEEASPSKLAELVSACWKMIAGKALEESFKKLCITNALNGTESDIVWDNSNLDCPDLKKRLRRICRLGVRLDSQVKQTVNKFVSFYFKFCVDRCFLQQRNFMFQY
jgi:hypothetical protein